MPKYVTSKVTARGDPGYFLTSKMVSECALCLATQTDQIPAKYNFFSIVIIIIIYLLSLCRQGGIYTPSSSMGHQIVERMKTIGMKFEIDGPYTP